MQVINTWLRDGERGVTVNLNTEEMTLIGRALNKVIHTDSKDKEASKKLQYSIVDAIAEAAR